VNQTTGKRKSNSIVIKMFPPDRTQRSGTRKTEVLTFSVPPEMRRMIDDLAKQESRTRSVLIREAITRYIAEEKKAQIYRYAEQKALEKGITEDQIEEIIDAERE